MSSQNFGMKNYMKGALLLTVAALLVKIMSAVYRVPYQNLVGDQGFYVYQQVYPFISFFVVWTSSGFAVATSKMLADLDARERLAQRHAIMRVMFYYLTVLSVFFFSVLFFGANYFAEVMHDPQLAPLLKMGSFVTLCMPVLALLKGSFQSRGLMEPVAYAQVFEQMIRVAFILVGTFIVMTTTKSVYDAGAVAFLGTVLGEVAGIVLLVVYWKRQQAKVLLVKKRIKAWPIIKEITIYSISISMSSLLLLCFQLVDSFTIFSTLLKLGIGELAAMELKGAYDRGQPLVQLGIVIASSLSLAIVPLVAFKAAQKNGRGAVPFLQLTYRTSLLFGIAAALGLVLVMPYVNQLLFKTDALSNVLILYVIQIVPLSIILTFTAILQGYSKLKIPALILVGAILLKLVGNTLLIEKIGIIGAACASTVALFVAAGALMYYMKKLKGITLAEGSFYRRLISASIAMTLAVKGAAWILALVVGELDSRIDAATYSMVLIVVGAVVFLTLAAKWRLLSVKEWFLIPAGRRMAAYQLWLNQKK